MSTPPKIKRATLEDVTFEAAIEVMRDSPDGILLFRDEMSGFFGAMEKYSGGAKGASADRAFWLQTYDGGSYQYSRVTKGHQHIKNISACMLGGIQPDVIRKIGRDSQEDGLIQRFLPVVLPKGTLGRDDPLGDEKQMYNATIAQLTMLSPAGVGRAQADVYENIVPVRFDQGGQAIFRERLAKHLEMTGVEAIAPQLASHFGKLNGIFVRLCLTFHCIENAYSSPFPAVINENTVKRVALFMDQYTTKQAIAFYCGLLGLAGDADDLREIAMHILHKELDEFMPSSLARGTRTAQSLIKADKIIPLCEKLVIAGWLLPIDAVKSKLPRWKVNPAVHQLFHEQQIEESARRASVRETMASLSRGTT